MSDDRLTIAALKEFVQHAKAHHDERDFIVRIPASNLPLAVALDLAPFCPLDLRYFIDVTPSAK